MARARLPWIAAWLAACGGTQAAGPALYPGDAVGEPRMEALPAVGVPEGELTETMRFGLLLAEQAFELVAPPQPLPPSAEHIKEWADEELTDWLEKKSALVLASRAELDQAAEETHVQRIVAGALVGLLYEDVARVLLAIPVPTELDTDPEIARIYREVIDFQARPYLEHARRAYRACAMNAVEPKHMRHFSRFCADRRDQMPGHDEPDGTTVTVTVE